MGNFRDNDRGFSRDRPRGNFGGGRNFRDNDRRSSGRDKPRAEMHNAVCDKCKKECQVPFKPSGEKPVLCSDCFRNQGNTHEGFSSRSNGNSSSGVSQEQFKELNSKVDKILEILESIEFEDEESEEDEAIEK